MLQFYFGNYCLFKSLTNKYKTIVLRKINQCCNSQLDILGSNSPLVHEGYPSLAKYRDRHTKRHINRQTGRQQERQKYRKKGKNVKNNKEYNVERQRHRKK